MAADLGVWYAIAASNREPAVPDRVAVGGFLYDLDSGLIDKC